MWGCGTYSFPGLVKIDTTSGMTNRGMEWNSRVKYPLSIFILCLLTVTAAEEWQPYVSALLTATGSRSPSVYLLEAALEDFTFGFHF